MKIVFTWDDGALEDLKLFDLHRKYNIPGMFFVPNFNKEGREVLTPEMIRDNYSDIISFGGHTVTHSYLPTIPADELDSELKDNRDYLSELTGNPIEHFCLPGGKYDEKLLETAFKYFKTVRTADTMNYKHNGVLCKPTFHFYPRGKKSLLVNAIRHKNIKAFWDVVTNIDKSYFELFYSLLEKNKNSNSVLIFWGHSWEIEELNIWSELENLLKYLSENYAEFCVKYDEIF